MDGDVRWLRVPSSYFLADPCWLSETDGLFVAERLQFRRRVGRIVLCRVAGDKVELLRELDLPRAHYSYPMVYTVRGKTFIVPECAQHQRVSRIEVSTEGEVLSQNALVEGYRIVDPTLFEADGKFWIFGNPLHNWDGELIVLSAPAMDGPWTEAGFSPMAIPNCRGAGRPIRRNGVNYWLTQHNETRYGGGIVVRKIDKIDDDGLEQEPIAILLPDPKGQYPLGMHTVAHGTDHYLIDGLRIIIRPTRPLDVLISRSRRRRRPD